MGALAWGILRLGDMLVGGTATFDTVPPALGAAIVIGLLVGGASGLVLPLIGKLPVRAWSSLWLVAGLVYGLVLASQLGAFEAIGGRYTTLGWLALTGSIGLGLYFAVLACICQPTTTRPRGWAASLRRLWRFLLATAISLIGVALLLVDTHAFPLTYPAAHVALRWGASLSVLASLLVLTSRYQPSPSRLRASRIALGVLVVAVLPILSMVDARDRATLDALLQRPLVGLDVRTLRYLTDVDRDGYSALLGGGDCVAFDGDVHPGTNEIPGNGLDDNCLGGDAMLWATYDASTAVVPETPAPLSVVIISIDTLRADRMSLYGYERDTTPAIDAWAKSATRFERAYTGGPWTALAMSSMFRGVYPRRLQWTFLWETSRMRLLRRGARPFGGERKVKVFATPVDDTHRTLSEWMSLRGMRVEAVVDDGRSQFLEPRLNVSGKWDHFEKAVLHGKNAGNASVTAKATERLHQLSEGPPFLLWVHYFGPHDSPKRKHGRPRYGRRRSDLYDHMIRVTDAEVGKLLSEIDRLEGPTAVILTSDHGEEFLSNHRGHGANLKDANIRVPLLVRGPGFEPGSSDAVVSLVDVLPTVLTWTGVSLPRGLDGQPLQELWDQHPPKRRIVLSETWRFDRSHKVQHDEIAVMDDAHKLEVNLVDQTAQLRAIGPDGFEKEENLIGRVERPALAESMNSYLERNRVVNVSE